jgi:hypothetical protein
MELRDFRNVHRGERICVLSPGASINHYPDEFWIDFFSSPVISISNSILAKRHFGLPDYWIGFDDFPGVHKTIHSCADDLAGRVDHIVFFAPFKINCAGINSVHVWNFKGSNGLLEFLSMGPDAAEGLVTDSSLQGAISLAIYMGSKNIRIAGADFGQFCGEYYWDAVSKFERTPRNERKYAGQSIHFEPIFKKALSLGIKIERVMPNQKEALCNTK